MQIVKVPGINGLGKTNGCEKAPDLIVGEGEKIEVNRDNIAEQEKQIYFGTKKFFGSGKKVIFVGGDHSISYSIGKAFLDNCKKNKKEPCLVVFDAHADCMPPLKEPTHEEWLRGLIEYGFSPEKVLLIGTRSIYPREEEYLSQKKIKRISVQEIRGDLDKVLEEIKKFISKKEVYLSFDIDVFDSSLIKATGYVSENGVYEEEIMKILDVIMAGKLVGADLVEINPDLEGFEESLVIARRVLEKIGKS